MPARYALLANKSERVQKLRALEGEIADRVALVYADGDLSRPERIYSAYLSLVSQDVDAVNWWRSAH